MTYSSTLAFAIALIAASTASAQIRIPSGVPTGQTLPALVADMIVTTNVKTTTGTHTQVESGKFWRATDGRTRQDTALGSLINNRLADTLIHLSHGDKVATITVREARATPPAPATATGTTQAPPAPSSPAPVAAPAPPQSSRDPRGEDLGEKTIGGFKARGRRITVPNPAGMRLGLLITETWTAREVGLILYSKQISPSGETEQRYENVQIVEPEPGVFEVPAGYAVQERTPQTAPAR